MKVSWKVGLFSITFLIIDGFRFSAESLFYVDYVGNHLKLRLSLRGKYYVYSNYCTAVQFSTLHIEFCSAVQLQ